MPSELLDVACFLIWFGFCDCKRCAKLVGLVFARERSGTFIAGGRWRALSSCKNHAKIVGIYFAMQGGCHGGCVTRGGAVVMGMSQRIYTSIFN